jgi:hypothetical protein
MSKKVSEDLTWYQQSIYWVKEELMLILRILCVTTTLLFLGNNLFQTAFAESAGIRPVETYSREIFKPFDVKYNYASVQSIVAAIRAEGHSISTGHPRIFIKPNNKTALKQKISQHFSDWMQSLVSLADSNFGATITDPGGHHNEPDAQPVVLVEALIYQLGVISGVSYQHTPLEYGQDAVQHLVRMAESETNYEHVEYLALPLGYDWLYDLMNEQQRQTVALKLVEYAQPMNNQIVVWNNPPGARLLGVLAVHGDYQYVDKAEVEKLLGYFHGGMVFGDPMDLPVTISNSDGNFSENHIFVPEGPGWEGLVYNKYYHPFLPILLAWRDQTGEDYFKLPFFQEWTVHMTHYSGNEYEFAGKYWRKADKAWIGRIKFLNMYCDLGLAPSNPVIASLAKYHHGGNYLSKSQQVLYMLLSDPAIQAKSPTEVGLSTTAHFRVVNNIFSRNSWQGTDSTWVFFQSPTWSRVRDLGPLNDIVIWKNGGMLLGKHEQAHDYDGGNRTNTLLLYDENDSGKTFIPRNVMDRAVNRDSGAKGLRLEELNKGLLSYHNGLRYFEERGGSYLYAFGDGGQDFRAVDDNGNSLASPSIRLDGWSRQFVWFRTDDNSKPDHFVILDRIAKESESVVEHLRFNFGANPSIRDQATNNDLGGGAAVHPKGSSNPGYWRYDNANRIVSTNTVTTGWGTAHGRLFVDTLLPKFVTYYRMGGVQARNIDLFGNLRTSRLEVSGSEDDPQNIIKGMWRVQMTASQKNSYQTYLHVLQATDATVETPDATQLLEGQGIIGAQVAGNIVLFSQFENLVVNASIVLPNGTGAGSRLLLTNLVPFAFYDVVLGGNSRQEQASKAGTIFLTVGVLPPGAGITIGKEIGADTQPPASMQGLRLAD